jgi:predicted nuclease of predicted toxin-antitoxin system
MLYDAEQKVKPVDRKDCTGFETVYYRQLDGNVEYTDATPSGLLGPACLLDENMPPHFAGLFLDMGFRVERVTNTLPGANDAFLLHYAQERKQILVTQDKGDFGRLVFAEDVNFSQGVLLVREPDVEHVQEVIKRCDKPLRAYFTTVDHKSFPRQVPLLEG